MLIVCPSCAKSYDVEPASLQPIGRKVRCVRCRAVWHAEPTRADKLTAAAGEISPQIAMPAPDSFAAASGPLADGDPADSSLATPEFAAAAEPDHAASDGEAVAVDGPPIAPVDLDEGQPAADGDTAASPGNEPPEDIETYAARRQRRGAGRKATRWPLSHLQTGILALLIANGVLIGWRADIVRIVPQTASFYAMLGLPVNLRGLVFEDITTSTEQHEGVPILVVEGNIVNDTRKAETVAKLKFVARNVAREEIYSWTAVPPRTTLPPGERVAFRTRFASPPQDVHDVMVRFVNRRDVLAGGP